MVTLNLMYVQVFKLRRKSHSLLYDPRIQHCLGTGMQNGDEASPSISLAVRGQLLKMLIPFEPHGSNFAYLYIFTLSGVIFVSFTHLFSQLIHLLQVFSH